MPRIKSQYRRRTTGDPRSSRSNRPFESLRTLIDRSSLRPGDFDDAPSALPRLVEGESDGDLFRRAMADVKPLPGRRRVALPNRNPEPPPASRDPDTESLIRLNDLVRDGKGFVVADTPEYMEGARYCDNPEVVRRLHQGEFSIQGHVDLHGLSAIAAQEVLERFLKESLTSGKRAVLIVHGRGLSSPAKPVLKRMVQDWLDRGPWRKWVIAYASARSCDGGAGATYVLLRRRPFTKRHRKRG